MNVLIGLRADPVVLTGGDEHDRTLRGIIALLRSLNLFGPSN